jgi:hypothetical protein
MGSITLDPASCDKANEVVQADEYYDEDQDGLSRKWTGTVFLNPPYSRGEIEKWVAKLLGQEGVTRAIVLTNNSTETGWWQALARRARAIAFPDSRVKFWYPDEHIDNGPLQGQSFFLFCRDDADVETTLMAFHEEFASTCCILRLSKLVDIF